MKYLQLHPDGTIRAVHPGKPYAPPDGDYLEVEDSEVPADLHQYAVQNGKLVLRPQADYDAVLANRAKKSELELLREELTTLKGRADATDKATADLTAKTNNLTTVTGDLTTKTNDLDMRTGALEVQKVPPLEQRATALEQDVAALKGTP